MPIVLMLLCVLICLASCDGKRSGAVLMHPSSVSSESPSPTTAGSAPQALTHEQALAEIAASAPAAGVEPELWDELTAELARVLTAREVSQIPVHPPEGVYNRVEHLQFSAQAGEPLVMTWSYVNTGDYNQDGLVSINDLTPLGQHFEERNLGFPLPWSFDHAMSVVDGNGDAIITINDITPLGANYQSRVSEFAVFASGNQGIRKIGAVDFADAYTVPNKRKSFRFEIEPAYVDDEYWIAPSDGTSLGVPSLPQGSEALHVTNVSPASGVTGQQATFAARAEGSPPFSCLWDFGAAATPSTSTEISPTVALGAPGEYTCSVTVSSDVDADTYEFMLLVLDEGAAVGPGDWWMYGHDARHTGRSAYVGPATTKLRWQKSYIGVWPDSSPAIGADGVVYVGTGQGDSLLAVNPDGTEKWSFPVGNEVKCGPAIGADGTLYIGSFGGALYAVNPDGSEQWSYPLGDDVIWSSPAVDPGGNIYIGCDDGKLYAITPGGEALWTFPTGDGIFSSPAIADDGTVYFGSMDGVLYAIGTDGLEAWTFPTFSSIAGGPAIGDDGTIYVGSCDQYLYAINPDGSEAWSYNTGIPVKSTPALAADGTIYANCHSGTQHGTGKFVAINPGGSLKWEFKPTSGCMITNPVVDAEGFIYFGSENNTFYSLDPEGNVRWVYYGGPSRSTPAIGPDGTLYFTNSGGSLVAMGPGGGTPDPVPVEILSVEPQYGDAGGDVIFSAGLRGSQPYTYQWDFGDGATPSQSTDAIPIVTLGGKGAYEGYLRVNNGSGLEASRQFWYVVGDGTAWTQSYYGSAADVDVDAAGNIYVAGYTEHFGGGGMLLLKYSPAGELLWQRICRNASAADVEVGSGGIYVAGGTGPYSTDNVTLLKYSPAGELLWMRIWGTGNSEVATGLALDSGMLDGIEHIYVSATQMWPGYEDMDAVLVKFTPEGDLLWEQTWGGDLIDTGGPIAVYYSEAGSYEVVYMAGSTESYGATGRDSYLLRFLPTGGDPLWQFTWDGGVGYDMAEAMVLDGSENIYLAVATQQDHGEGGQVDYALLKYSKGGMLLSEQTWHESSYDYVQAIALIGSSVYLGGMANLGSTDDQDYILLKYSTAGDLQWQRVWGRWNGELGHLYNTGMMRSMAACPTGELVLVGSGGLGLWTYADGQDDPAMGLVNVPPFTVTDPDGIVQTPTGQTAFPDGEGPGDLTVMKSDPSG
jgi:outer membrane protein assembly factor BamB